MSNFLPIEHTFKEPGTARFLVPSCVGVSIIEIDSSIDISFLSENYQLMGRAEGSIVGMSGGCGGVFHWLEVTSAVAQSIKLFAYGGTFSVSKLAGIVDISGVVETAPDFSRVLSEDCFIGSAHQTPVSGEYGFTGAFNPGGGGNFCLSSLDFYSPSSSAYSIYVFTDMSAIEANSTDYSSYGLRNLYLNKNPSDVFGFRGRGGSLISNVAAVSDVLASGSGDVSVCSADYPVIIPPGTGVLCQSLMVNYDNSISFKGFRL